VVITGGLLFVACYAVLVALLMARGTYDEWGGALFGPILLMISLPALHRQAKREGDMRLFWLLAGALLVKLLGSIARQYVSFGIYGAAGADASGYHNGGAKIAAGFRAGDFDPGLPFYTDTMFIRLLTGIIYTFTGPTLLGGYLIYSWLAFWGLFGFYRAFVMTVPGGRSRSYARLLFFLPSMLFWPSGIGKESWMVFVLGIASLGVAHLFTGRIVRGLAITSTGLAGVLVVRPHMAGIVGIAIAIAYVVGGAKAGDRRVSPVARGAVIVTVVVGAAFLLSQATTFISDALKTEDGLTSLTGIQSALEATADRTATGGSTFFVPSIIESPASAPLAIVTVLFRPFLFEATSIGLLVASIEGAFLLMLTLTRFRGIASAFRNLRRLPYATYALAYSGMFIIAYSSLANFGLLTRQRVQLLPFFLMILCMPRPAKRGEHGGSRA